MGRKFHATAAVLLVVLAPLAATAADFVVVNTNNSGSGSLHQAIIDANGLPGADRILFNIPGAGVQKIDVSQDFLPAITDAVTIDGYTQPGSKPNTLDTGSNAVLLVQIDGGNNTPINSTPAGLTINAPDCTVRGLIITRFAPYTFGLGGGGRKGGFGVLAMNGKCIIEGNFIGTDGASNSDLGNSEAGIRIAGADYRVGGPLAAARNVIAGNALGIWASDSQRASIAGNQIGTNPAPAGATTSAMPGLRNSIGVVCSGAFTQTVIGGVTAASSNLIAGNDTGIRLAYTNPGTQQTTLASGVIVQGNAIGLQPQFGASAQVNQRIGIEIRGSDNLIGGLNAAEGNRICYNQIGISVRSDTFSPAINNAILSDAIFANSSINIDLVSNNPAATFGPTSNDLGDGDEGANHLQNFPVIVTAETVAAGASSEPNGTIRGSLNSTPSRDFTLQFYRYNLEPVLLGTTVVHTDGAGNAPFVFSFYDAAPAQSGSYYTATATDADGNTSEFMPPNGPVQLANISSRANVLTDDNILIGGFIIKAGTPKKVIIRALGPSLNVPTALADPYLELYDSSGTLLAKNDDWRAGQQQEVTNSGVAPSRDVESAIVATLPAGNYTAQVSSVNRRTGVGVVEIYDLDPFTAGSGRLVNLSSRAFVQTGENALIGGVIIRGDAPQRILVRGIGPDLKVPSPMANPVLELHDGNGDVIATNDDWRDQQEMEISATGLAPNDDRDAAILTSLPPGLYTAVLRGKNETNGVAIVEFYDLAN